MVQRGSAARPRCIGAPLRLLCRSYATVRALPWAGGRPPPFAATQALGLSIKHNRRRQGSETLTREQRPKEDHRRQPTVVFIGRLAPGCNLKENNAIGVHVRVRGEVGASKAKAKRNMGEAGMGTRQRLRSSCRFHSNTYVSGAIKAVVPTMPSWSSTRVSSSGSHVSMGSSSSSPSPPRSSGRKSGKGSGRCWETRQAGNSASGKCENAASGNCGKP